MSVPLIDGAFVGIKVARTLVWTERHRACRSPNGRFFGVPDLPEGLLRGTVVSVLGGPLYVVDHQHVHRPLGRHKS
jgi:hypothetical protein